LIDELVPCLAVVIDEIVVGFEDAVREPVSVMNCQTFSTGLENRDPYGDKREPAF
jgi:hypothetical protein